jgi:hypothetical protein
MSEEIGKPTDSEPMASSQSKLMELIGKITTNTVQSVLALGCTGVLSWGFIAKIVPVEVYVPIVTMMIVFFFKTTKS